MPQHKRANQVAAYIKQNKINLCFYYSYITINILTYYHTIVVVAFSAQASSMAFHDSLFLIFVIHCSSSFSIKMSSYLFFGRPLCLISYLSTHSVILYTLSPSFIIHSVYVSSYIASLLFYHSPFKKTYFITNTNITFKIIIMTIIIKGCIIFKDLCVNATESFLYNIHIRSAISMF